MQVGVFGDNGAIGQGQRNRGNLNVNLLHRPAAPTQVRRQPAILDGCDVVKGPDGEVAEVSFEEFLVEAARRAVEDAVPKSPRTGAPRPRRAPPVRTCLARA